MNLRKYNVLEWLSILMFAGMILLISAQVVFRYCFNNPLSWTEELARLFFVFGTFMAAAAAVRRRSHISIEVVFERLPSQMRAYIHVLNQLLVLIFTVTVFITSFPILKASYTILTGALRFPVTLFYAPVTISFLLIAWFTLRTLLRRE